MQCYQRLTFVTYKIIIRPMILLLCIVYFVTISVCWQICLLPSVLMVNQMMGVTVNAITIFHKKAYQIIILIVFHEILLSFVYCARHIVFEAVVTCYFLFFTSQNIMLIVNIMLIAIEIIYIHSFHLILIICFSHMICHEFYMYW